MPHQNGVDMVPPHQNQETLLIPGEEEEESCNLCRERPKPLKADEIMRNYCDADFGKNLNSHLHHFLCI